MTAPKSPHLPEVAGEIVSVTGTLLVETKLREVQAFSATLAQASSAGAAAVSAVVQAVEPGPSYQLLLQVWEDDLVTPSTAAAMVSWLAIGK